MTQPFVAAQLLRGQIWAMDVPGVGEKFFLICSNNQRNASAYPHVHVARVTTTRPRHPLPSIVQLPRFDFGGSFVMCDELTSVAKDDLKRQVSAVSAQGMRLVAAGIKHSLSLP